MTATRIVGGASVERMWWTTPEAVGAREGGGGKWAPEARHGAGLSAPTRWAGGSRLRTRARRARRGQRIGSRRAPRETGTAGGAALGRCLVQQRPHCPQSSACPSARPRPCARQRVPTSHSAASGTRNRSPRRRGGGARRQGAAQGGAASAAWRNTNLPHSRRSEGHAQSR